MFTRLIETEILPPKPKRFVGGIRLPLTCTSAPPFVTG